MILHDWLHFLHCFILSRFTESWLPVNHKAKTMTTCMLTCFWACIWNQGEHADVLQDCREIMIYCGGDEVTAEFECFYFNSELLTLSELQCNKCRKWTVEAAGGELSLLQPEGFVNQNILAEDCIVGL